MSGGVAQAAQGARAPKMPLRERTVLGVVLGAVAGGAAVLFGEALTNKKNNRLKFDGVASAEGINSDRYLAVHLKDLQNDFGAHDPNVVQTIIRAFEDMIALYEDARRTPQAFYGWKASQYDQNIQAQILVLTRKAMADVNRVRGRLEQHYDDNGKPNRNPEVLIKLVDLTRELRQVSTRYREQIHAAVATA